MLAVSDQAASAIGGILAAREMPDEAGVRLTREAAAQDGDGAEAGIRLDLVTAPREGDATVDGAPVYIDPETATLLEGKLLDAEVSGDQVRFSVKEQS